MSPPRHAPAPFVRFHPPARAETIEHVTFPPRLVIPVLVALTLSACGSSPASTVPPATARVPSTSVVVSSAPAKAPDAKAVLDKLTAAGLPVANPAVQDENSDPNNLLGRPNEYTSRARFQAAVAQVGA